MPNFFLNSPWPGLAVWSVLYLSDYALTLLCARLYRAGASDKIVFEGSYEITPFFQKDIDSLRMVSPRFLAILLLTAATLGIIWWLAMQSLPDLYYFALGALILTQLVVHTRHLRNLALFRAIIGTDAVRGRIEYSRPLLLRMSSVEFLTFSGLLLLLFLFEQNVFILGGTTACLSIAAKHRRLARKQGFSATIPDQSQP